MIEMRVPRVLAGLLFGHDQRPLAGSVDDVLAWLKVQPWPHVELSSDEKRRLVVKRLMFVRWLVDAGRVGEGRP